MEGRCGVLQEMGAAASVAPIEDEDSRKVRKWNRRNWNQCPNTQTQRY